MEGKSGVDPIKIFDSPPHIFQAMTTGLDISGYEFCRILFFHLFALITAAGDLDNLITRRLLADQPYDTWFP